MDYRAARRVGFYREMIERFDPELAKGYPRMADHFSDEPAPCKERLCYFLKHAGILYIASGSHFKDVFTGEDTGIMSSVRNDGVYSWSPDLAWYVEKYGLSLPDDFVEHAMAWPDRRKEKLRRAALNRKGGKET